MWNSMKKNKNNDIQYNKTKNYNKTLYSINDTKHNDAHRYYKILTAVMFIVI